ncbi:MAG: hypothetical protein WAO83_11630 [Fuerstiella sp.]
MKRISAASARNIHHARKGTIFHYYMMYLFLSSVMLTSAGLCMHTVLKADRLDGEVSTYLRSLLQLERSLRTDAGNAVAAEVQANVLVFTNSEGQTHKWVCNKNVVTRETSNAEGLQSSERFAFHKGTQLSFQESGSSIVATLIEAAIMTHTENGQETSSTESNIVQMILPLPETTEGEPS